MAKATKTATAGADTGSIDIASLTPAQLSALQKQLKAKAKENVGPKEERFKLIDSMLQEKSEDGSGFRWTTRDILNKLVENGLVKPNGKEDEQNEIKKIQARKQFHEHATGKDGKPIHPPGKFGYKASAGFGFKLDAAKIVAWLADPENVKTLTIPQRAEITKHVK